MLAGECTHTSLIRESQWLGVSTSHTYTNLNVLETTACGLSEQEELQQTHERGQGQPDSHTVQSSVLSSKLILKAVAGLCSKGVIRSTEW